MYHDTFTLSQGRTSNSNTNVHIHTFRQYVLVMLPSPLQQKPACRIAFISIPGVSPRPPPGTYLAPRTCCGVRRPSGGRVSECSDHACPMLRLFVIEWVRSLVALSVCCRRCYLYSVWLIDMVRGSYENSLVLYIILRRMYTTHDT